VKSVKIKNISNLEYSIAGIYIKDFINKRFCIFDFEATGPNQEEDYITQVGAIIVDGYKIREELTFCSLV